MTEKQIQEFWFFWDCLEKLALSLDVNNPLMREIAIVLHGFLGVLGVKDIDGILAFSELSYRLSQKI